MFTFFLLKQHKNLGMTVVSSALCNKNKPSSVNKRHLFNLSVHSLSVSTNVTEVFRSDFIGEKHTREALIQTFLTISDTDSDALTQIMYEKLVQPQCSLLPDCFLYASLCGTHWNQFYIK